MIIGPFNADRHGPANSLRCLSESTRFLLKNNFFLQNSSYNYCCLPQKFPHVRSEPPPRGTYLRSRVHGSVKRRGGQQYEIIWQRARRMNNRTDDVGELLLNFHMRTQTAAAAPSNNCSAEYRFRSEQLLMRTNDSQGIPFRFALFSPTRNGVFHRFPIHSAGGAAENSKRDGPVLLSCYLMCI